MAVRNGTSINSILLQRIRKANEMMTKHKTRLADYIEDNDALCRVWQLQALIANAAEHSCTGDRYPDGLDAQPEHKADNSKRWDKRLKELDTELRKLLAEHGSQLQVHYTGLAPSFRVNNGEGTPYTFLTDDNQYNPCAIFVDAPRS